MRTVVLAYHDMGCAGLRNLIEQGYDVVAVFTHADDPEETGWFESVAELAARREIPVFAPENLNDPIWVARMQELAPEIIFSFYYRNLIAQDILDIPPAGCLNLHGSMLPKYRGRAPANWVLVNGESETGVTLHYMTDRPDAGDIVCQVPVTISVDDTGKTLRRDILMGYTAESAGRALASRAYPAIKTPLQIPDLDEEDFIRKAEAAATAPADAPPRSGGLLKKLLGGA